VDPDSPTVVAVNLKEYEATAIVNHLKSSLGITAHIWGGGEAFAYIPTYYQVVARQADAVRAKEAIAELRRQRTDDESSTN